ncbi:MULTISPECIES: ABC transporter ATP-binding protein [Streptomyces violaceusniger group]|uniref:ABC transporter ATP-binding protein n=2 Tax=Streptomyces rhizosphaericus TaxID=114699 RepID=A0ABN1SG37_9ACTN|nr:MULTISPECIES: ABC transporter ATP-binding protein [Streptomyces violaceusniger group]
MSGAPGASGRRPSRLWPYLAPHRGALLAVMGLSLVSSAAALAQPLLVQRTLGAASGGSGLGTALALLVGVVVAAAALEGVQRYLLQRTAEGVVLMARRTLVETLLRLPVGEFDRRRTGDLISRVGADTTLLRSVVTGGLVDLGSGVVVALGAVVLMASIDPPLLVVTLLSVGAGVVAVATVSRRVRHLSGRAQQAVGAMTASVERALTAVRTIRAARAEEREAAQIGRSAAAAYEAGLRVARLESLAVPLANVAMQAALLSVLGYGSARVASGAVDVADLVAFVLYLLLFVQPMAQALQAYTTFQAGLGALARIEEVRALPTEPQAGPAAVRRPVPVGPAHRPALAFENVDFDYPDGTPVLRGVSLDIPRGFRVALVGPSGAGKSTLLALAERFYEPTAGAVRLHGVDARELPLAVLRGQLGYVEQDAPALAGSLRDNLLLGAPGADDAALLRVLDAVNLCGLVHRTPQGLDAQVGDGGVLLSGGERQRLAIARVLLAAPPLLLLDEPTASLDARNEAALAEAIDSVSVNRTVLVVAHRLSTIVRSDLIVVLEEGRVVARGTHAELVDASPLYRELAGRQLLV